MFFQNSPPDTSAYMIAGYAIFFLILAIYLASLLVRARNLRQDVATLESMRLENKAAEDRSAASKRTAGKAIRPKPKAARAKTGRSGQVRKKAGRKQ